MGTTIEIDRDLLVNLMNDLLAWSQDGLPAPYKFAEWSAILEHRLGLTEPMDFDDRE